MAELKLKDVETFVEVLKAYEKRSTCSRVQVASIIVRNARSIMEGWNGVPSGFDHCCDFFDAAGVDVTTSEGRELHRGFSEQYEHHAEANAIGQCAALGIATQGCTIVQTVSPCMQCAKLIKISGITSVYYMRDYDRSSTDALSYLCQNGIEVYKINEGDSISIERVILNNVYKPFELNGKLYSGKWPTAQH